MRLGHFENAMEKEGFLSISVRLWHEVHTMKSMKLCLLYTGTAFS